MIPVCLLAGLALGRWWRLVVPIAAMGWAAVLLLGGTGSGVTFAISAAALAGLNAAVGAAFNRGSVALAGTLEDRGGRRLIAGR
jgi:hypothetical protein